MSGSDTAHPPEAREKTAEQRARDLLEQCGVEDAQSFTAGDVVALANFIADAAAHRSQIERIRNLAATWAVDDDTYLHLDGQDLGYADAAVQIIAIIGAINAERTGSCVQRITKMTR